MPAQQKGHPNRKGVIVPKLLRFSETAGCGATIKLENEDVVYVSIAKTGVLVRKWDVGGGFFKGLMSNFFGPKLYNESNVYKNAETAKALKMLFPIGEPGLPPFKNPALSAFATAIWNCRSAAEVCTMLNEAVTRTGELDGDAVFDAELHIAFEKAKNSTPANIKVRTYNVIFDDGKSQETRFVPEEINSWVARCNADAAKESKPYRVVRVVDGDDKVVWGK
jgi:hypothetical protein